MKTSDFDYDLPDELIAQAPLEDRSASRMLVLNREDGSIQHSSVRQLPDFFAGGDLMVFNNTQVFPARTRGIRQDTGGKVELVFVNQLDEEAETGGIFSSRWLCIFGSGSKTRVGQNLALCGGVIKAELIAVLDQGHVEALIHTSRPVMDILDDLGEVPLPPYIGRKADDSDRARYQTVYAREKGAVAAPTAGLHFDEQLIKQITEKGIESCEVTLHVGPGTFLPVKEDDLENHIMHSERYSLDKSAANAVNSAISRGDRVVAVGTTSARTLEGVWEKNDRIIEDAGETDIFIFPPYEFKAVDVLFTNFHLPKSTLLMMVSAFAGRESLMNAYQSAIRERYRFYSYGDCMLIV